MSSSRSRSKPKLVFGRDEICPACKARKKKEICGLCLGTGVISKENNEGS